MATYTQAGCHTYCQPPASGYFVQPNQLEGKELNSEGHEIGLRDSVQERINKMKGRSVVCRSYHCWAHKSQNIQNLATLERLIQRVDWYCNETKCVQARSLAASNKMQMRISMLDAFRSEFRFAPPFVCELLRDFDGEFLRNMEWIKLVGGQNLHASIGPTDAKTTFEGPKMDYLHWKLRRVAHQIVAVLEEECAFAQIFFGEDVQKRFKELFPNGISPAAAGSAGPPGRLEGRASLAQILGLSKLRMSWPPEEAESTCGNSCGSCSPDGYVPLVGDEELPKALLPFRSIWEIPRLIELCDRLDIHTLRSKLGTISVFGPSNDTSNQVTQRSEVNQSQQISIDYGYFPEADVVKAQSVSSMTPMQPIPSDDEFRPPSTAQPQTHVRFASPCPSTGSFMSIPPPMSMPPPGAAPPMSMSPGMFGSMMGSMPASMPASGRLTSPWKILTPENEGLAETKQPLLYELQLKEVKFLPFLISASLACHTLGDPGIPALPLQCRLNDLSGPGGTIYVDAQPKSITGDPPVFDLSWNVVPKVEGQKEEIALRSTMMVDFSEPFVTLHCSLPRPDGTSHPEVEFRIAIPDGCRQEDWLKVMESFPVLSSQLPALRDELRLYLHEVPKALFFNTLPSFAMSLSQLKTVLLADIDSGTMMQSRLLAAFASGVFALASLSFNFFMAQRGREMELFASNLTQSLHNITQAFQI